MASDIRFTIIEYYDGWVNGDLHIYVLSDILCHMYCRYTYQPPVYHPHWRMRRGRPMNTDGKYCFVEYHDLQQLEPGDTISHTFILHDFIPHPKRWWYFWATVAGQVSPSNTPIFIGDYPDPTGADSLLHPQLSDKEVDGVIDHADQSVTPAKIPPSAIEARHFAFFIDMAARNFEAAYSSGYRNRYRGAISYSSLWPGGTLYASAVLAVNTPYLLAHQLFPNPTPTPNAHVITGLARYTGNQVRAFLRNDGTSHQYSGAMLIYELESQP